MINLTLQISNKLNERVEELAQELNSRKEELICDAIEDFLDAHEDFLDAHEDFAKYSPEQLEVELEELKQVGIDIEAMIKEAAKELMKEQALEVSSKKRA